MTIAWTITLSVLALLGSAWAGLRWFVKRIRRREVEAAHTITYQTNDPLLADLEPGRPALIYFTADWCGPCNLVQTPAVQQVKSDLGHTVQVFEIDADAHRDAMDRWGVMSLPRTFILDGEGQVRATNLNAVSAGMLKQQIAQAQNAPAPDATPHINTESDLQMPRSGIGIKFRQPIAHNDAN